LQAQAFVLNGVYFGLLLNGYTTGVCREAQAFYTKITTMPFGLACKPSYTKAVRGLCMNLLSKLIKPVYAHCDVPCGIYETDTMRHAADTCVRMVEKMSEVKGNDGDSIGSHEGRNNFIRMVHTKEDHAQKCKDQIYLLWSDYFKPEHLEKFPDLHDKMWQAAKQCSKVKQTVSLDEAKKLVALVAGIATMFEESKH
jgi:nickel superoxide dismutase